MISFSTCWNSSRHTDGEALIREITGLGFDTVELGHGTRISLLEGIMKAHGRGEMRISSLHNFCPLPVEVTTSAPDCFQFTSHRPNERERAVKQTMKTIDLAERLGVPFVVVHGGTVSIAKDFTAPLREMVREGKMYSREFVAAKHRALTERAKVAGLYVRRTVEALRRLTDYAGPKGVRLGLECRDRYEQVPNEEEFFEIFQAVNSPALGYWHDIGHAQLRANLTFADAGQWLGRVGAGALGCHLHDVHWPDKDHRAPLSGTIDYDQLLPHFPPNCLFVWEMSPRVKAEDIAEARGKWLARYPGTVAVREQ